MKLGVITSLWAYAEKLSVADSLDRIASLGLRYVDILGILHGNPQELSYAEKAHIHNRVTALDLVIGSLIQLPPGNIATEDESIRQRCMTYVQAGIDFIADLGGRQVLFNGGKRAFGVSHSQSWRNAVSFIRQASDYAQEKDVFITVEAEPYIYFLVNDLQTTYQMVTDVNHPNCKTTLDIGHMNLSRDAPETLDLIKPWTLRIHMSENDGILHANDILGTGTVNTGAYLSYLEEMDFAETCSQYEMDLVAVMELGVLGDDIKDPDNYAHQSMQHILNITPFMEL